MTVVSVDYYRQRTGDSDSSDSAVVEKLAEAQDMVEEYLGRHLELGEYTESQTVSVLGLFYPAAIPVSSVSASSNANSPDIRMLDTTAIQYVNVDDSVFPVWADTPRRRGGYEATELYATVTYRGGWPQDALPETLGRYLARLARALITGKPEGAAAMAGATTLKAGDVSVTYPAGSVEGMLNFFVPGMSRAIQGYRLGRL